MLSSRLVGHDDCDDDTIETQGTSENLDDQHLHEWTSLLGVEDSGVWTNNSDADATGEVSKSNHWAGSEKLVSRSLSLVELSNWSIGILVVLPWLWLGTEENSHNNSVNGDGLAEDNGDQVLWSNPRGLDGGTEDAASWDKDTPIEKVKKKEISLTVQHREYSEQGRYRFHCKPRSLVRCSRRCRPTLGSFWSCRRPWEINKLNYIYLE